MVFDAGCVTIADRVSFVATHFVASPPESEEAAPFDVRAFLRDLANRPHILTDDQVRELRGLAWMDAFMGAEWLKFLSNAPFEMEELVALLVEHCPCAPPAQTVQVAVQRRNGLKVAFVPAKALKTVARHWNRLAGPSSSARKSLAALPWFTSWLENRSRALCRVDRASTEARVQILERFYASAPPHWRDVVQLGDSARLKPLQWLQHIRPALRAPSASGAGSLTAEQRARLLAVAWMPAWLSGATSRKRARADAVSKSA